MMTRKHYVKFAVAPSNLLTASMPVASMPVTAHDLALIRELALYAAESMQAVINYELATGRDRPIVDAMRAYVRDARALLERLK